MSEFVECQNCGRRFFGENIDCPYCHGEQERRERQELVSGAASSGSLYRVLFASFHVVLAGIVVVAGLGLRHPSPFAVRAFLVVEGLAATVLLMGLLQRRQWARQAAIVYVVANAGLGLLAWLQRGAFVALAWGPGPLALLLFLVPLTSQQARERYNR